MRRKLNNNNLINKGVPTLKGDIVKKALYSRKGKWLQYFNTRNTATTINCSNFSIAKNVIEKSGISQELVITL